MQPKSKAKMALPNRAELRKKRDGSIAAASEAKGGEPDSTALKTNTALPDLAELRIEGLLPRCAEPRASKKDPGLARLRGGRRGVQAEVLVHRGFIARSEDLTT